MNRRKQAASRLFYLLGLLLAALWAIQPSLGSWVPVQATVYGRDRDLYTSVEEDEANEYYAVLDLCYDYQGRTFIAQEYLGSDGPTGWQLQELVQAVEEARRHPIGEVRDVFVNASAPERWAKHPPRHWVIPLLLILYSALTLLLAWEAPPLQVGFLCFAWLAAAVLRQGDYADTLPPNQDPRPLVAETRTLRAYERPPLAGPHKLDSLEQVLDEWGRPDSVWLEQSGELAYLVYRDGSRWERIWLHSLHREEGQWTPLGPPREEARD